ncbi:MAG: type II toxin-antitoxin system VapC family toxin [Deltaproteobacteria bacterium]|nr:type II toxin-antitoxin system VapC family toxin [Deltaproteobacteria bacterium]
MNRLFFDTSALVKIYHREKGSDTCLSAYSGQAEILISELARVELCSALYKKCREKEISQSVVDAVIRRFEEDCRDRFEVFHVASFVYDEAVRLLARYASATSLKTLDALQLATYLLYCEKDSDSFVCADEKLCQVARSEHAKVLKV